MHHANFQNRIHMEENQTDNHDYDENRRDGKSIFTYLLVLITLVIGLALITVIIVISIEFHQIHRLASEISETTSRSNSTLSSTSQQTSDTTTISSTTVIVADENFSDMGN